MTRDEFETAFREWRQNAQVTGLDRSTVISLASKTFQSHCRAWVLNFIADNRRAGQPIEAARVRDAVRYLPRPNLP